MRLLAALSALAVVGCSATVDEPLDSGDNASESLQASSEMTVRGAVIVESTTALPTSPSRVRSQVSARFLRIVGLEAAAAERMVDGSDAATIAESPLGCTYAEAEAPAATMAVDASIEMLDVGDILVHVLRDPAGGDSPEQEVTLPLAARAFPDVGELVSGVVYTSRDETTAVPDAGTYVIETTGSSAVDGFKLEIDAPATPEAVRLAGLLLDEDVVVTPGEALSVSWAAGEASDDRLVVELSDGVTHVSCIFADDGAAVVPEAFVAFPDGAELDVAVRRHRRAAVRLPAVDEAFVDFDFAVTSRAVVER